MARLPGCDGRAVQAEVAASNRRVERLVSRILRGGGSHDPRAGLRSGEKRVELAAILAKPRYVPFDSRGRRGCAFFLQRIECHHAASDASQPIRFPLPHPECGLPRGIVRFEASNWPPSLSSSTTSNPSTIRRGATARWITLPCGSRETTLTKRRESHPTFRPFFRGELTFRKTRTRGPLRFSEGIEEGCTFWPTFAGLSFWVVRQRAMPKSCR